MKIWIGGGQCSFHQAAHFGASFAKTSCSQPGVRYTELRLNPPIPVQEELRCEFWVENLHEAQHSPIVISTLSFKIALGDAANRLGLTLKVSHLAIHDSVAQLPGSFIVENKRAQPCLPKNK